MKYCHFLMLLMLANSACAGDSADDGQHVIYLGDDGVIVLRFQIQIDGKAPHEAFEQYVDDLMKSVDENHDGIVSTDEAKGKYLNRLEAMKARLIPLSIPAAPETSPDVSPADGKITRAEFLAYFKRIGLQPFVFRYLPNSTTPRANRTARQAPNATDAPLFEWLVSNRDGKLSPNELANALRTLRKLDLDDDETISAAELTLTNNQLGIQQPQSSNQGTRPSSPFLGLGSEESLPKQIRELIEKYDRFDAVKPGETGRPVRNQKLSRQELGVSIATFEKFDGDGDGQLDFDELRQFLLLPHPTLTIVVNVDTNEPLKAESVHDSFHERLSIFPDGSVNISLGATQLSIVRESYYDGGEAESVLKPPFLAADTDGNGYLERSETERAFLFGTTFEDLDADRNGKVFFDEAVAKFKIRFDAARSRTIMTISDQGRTLFEVLDTDRDQRLSFRELQAAKGKISTWDKDGDGLLSESEVPHQYRLSVTRGNLLNVGGIFNNPGMSQTGELPERTSGPIWFRKMDKNRDGEVSRREFLGDAAEFEKFDRNHDGFIDLFESVQTISE